MEEREKKERRLERQEEALVFFLLWGERTDQKLEGRCSGTVENRNSAALGVLE